nr:MAG TPA: hypothetical protein [Caudoviricetes sp.]
MYIFAVFKLIAVQSRTKAAFLCQNIYSVS